jgi:hypothetical protein
MAQHHGIWVYQAKRIDHYFAFDTLDWVDYDGYGSFGQSFETLLCVYVDA